MFFMYGHISILFSSNQKFSIYALHKGMCKEFLIYRLYYRLVTSLNMFIGQRKSKMRFPNLLVDTTQFYTNYTK